MPNDQTTEDYGHVADLIRGALLDCDEAALRAILSNNVNTIVSALRAVSDLHAAVRTRDQLIARARAGQDIRPRAIAGSSSNG